MSMPDLPLPPDQQSYANQFGTTSVSVALDGGASRFRVDQLGAVALLTVQWTLSKANYDYLNAFYRTAINFGSQPFTTNLYLDSSGLLSYVCHFIPGTFGLTSQSGLTFVVGAQLEVIPNSAYYANDAALIALGPQN